MTQLVVSPAAQPLRGSVPSAVDRTIATNAFLLASISNGRSELRGFARTVVHEEVFAFIRALGVPVEQLESGVIHIRGAGLFGLAPPKAALACTEDVAGLAIGLLGSQAFASSLHINRVQNTSEFAKILASICEALKARGARIMQEHTAPGHGWLVESAGLADSESLNGIAWERPGAAEGAKAALLMSGLYAHGETWIREPLLTADHTERMLSYLGAPIRAMGGTVVLDPSGWNGQLEGFKGAAVGDVASAAWLVCAASHVPGTQLSIRNVGLNPTRSGFFEWCHDAGLRATVEHRGETCGEPVGDIHAEYTEGFGASIGGERLGRTGSALPALACLATSLHGVTSLTDLSLLSVSERMTLQLVIGVLRSFGFNASYNDDACHIEGAPGRVVPATRIECGGHAESAMAASLLALRADGPCVVSGAEGIARNDRRFVAVLRSLGATVDVAADK